VIFYSLQLVVLIIIGIMTNFTLPASAVDALAESTTKLTSGISTNVPVIGNAGLCVDSLCTTGRGAVNFYYSPNPVAKVFFGASCLCGVIGAASSGTAVVTSFAGIPAASWFGSFGARGLNRLGKYTLHIGNVTSGKITNHTAIADLMS
jgi:hypothetical protein